MFLRVGAGVTPAARLWRVGSGSAPLTINNSRHNLNLSSSDNFIQFFLGAIRLPFFINVGGVYKLRNGETQAQIDTMFLSAGIEPKRPFLARDGENLSLL